MDIHERLRRLARAHDEAILAICRLLARERHQREWDALDDNDREAVLESAAQLAAEWNCDPGRRRAYRPGASQLADLVARQGTLYEELCAVEDALLAEAGRSVH